MEYKTVTLRLPIEVAQYIEQKTDGGFTESVKKIVGNLKVLETLADKEISETFSADEWKFFFDSLNGTMIEDWMRYRSDLLVAHNEDAELYDGTAKKWGIDLAILNEKCKILTSAQVDALYRKVERYWSKPVAESFEDALKRTVSELNDSAKADWADEKHIDLQSVQEDDECLIIDLGIGRWEPTFYTIKVDKDGWKVTDRSGKKHDNVLENFMHYFVMPLIPR